MFDGPIITLHTLGRDNFKPVKERNVNKVRTDPFTAVERNTKWIYGVGDEGGFGGWSLYDCVVEEVAREQGS